MEPTSWLKFMKMKKSHSLVKRERCVIALSSGKSNNMELYYNKELYIKKFLIFFFSFRSSLFCMQYFLWLVAQIILEEIN